MGLRQVMRSVCCECGKVIGCYDTDRYQRKCGCVGCKYTCGEPTQPDSHGLCILHLKEAQNMRTCGYCDKKISSKDIAIMSNGKFFCDEECYKMFSYDGKLT